MTRNKKQKDCRGPGREKTTFLYQSTRRCSLREELCDPFWLACGERKERKKRRRGKRARPGSTICTSSRQVPIDRESDGENWCLSHGGSPRHGRYPVLGAPCKRYRLGGLRTHGTGPCRSTSPSGRAGKMTGWEPWFCDMQATQPIGEAAKQCLLPLWSRNSQK